jgi:hypothetical protein
MQTTIKKGETHNIFVAKAPWTNIDRINLTYKQNYIAVMEETHSIYNLKLCTKHTHLSGISWHNFLLLVFPAGRIKASFLQLIDPLLIYLQHTHEHSY